MMGQQITAVTMRVRREKRRLFMLIASAAAFSSSAVLHGSLGCIGNACARRPHGGLNATVANGHVGSATTYQRGDPALAQVQSKTWSETNAAAKAKCHIGPLRLDSAGWGFAASPTCDAILRLSGMLPSPIRHHLVGHVLRIT